jgi:hypothetical protein
LASKGNCRIVDFVHGPTNKILKRLKAVRLAEARTATRGMYL